MRKIIPVDSVLPSCDHININTVANFSVVQDEDPDYGGSMHL
jgi:hypothetical protein